MLTNLLAAVQIVLSTNVVTTDNAQGCPMYPGPNVSPAVYGHVCTPFVPATERYVTTNVVEHTEVTVQLPTGPKTFTSDVTLSSTTTTYRKPDAWEAAGTKTNDVSPTKPIAANDHQLRQPILWGYQNNDLIETPYRTLTNGWIELAIPLR